MLNFSEWCRESSLKQVLDYRTAADGGIRMVHARQDDAIDCPASHDVTLVLTLNYDTRAPSHEYDFGFGHFSGRPTTGSLILLPHDVPTAKEGPGPYETLNMSFSYSDMCEILKRAEITPPQDFGVLHSRMWRDTFVEQLVQQLWADTNDGSPTGKLSSEGLFSALLARLLTLAGQPLPELHSRTRLSTGALQYVEQLMRDRLAEKISLDDLAEAAKYSRFHFSRLYREKTGETVSQTLMRLRVEKAASLIRDVGLDLSLAQVAAACGFSDQPHLTRLFRLRMGMTPAVFRKRL